MLKATAPVEEVDDDTLSTSTEFGAVHGTAQSLGRYGRFWQAGFVLPSAATVTAAFAIGVFGSAYTVSIYTQVAIYAVAVMGLTVLVGFAGQISFAQPSFMGLGAYMTATATTKWDWPPLGGVAVGFGLSIVVALLVGMVALRLEGHYLAMATLAIALGFHAFVSNADVFGGFAGMSGIPPMSVGPWEMNTLHEQFVLMTLVMLVAAFVVWRLGVGRFGRALRSVGVDSNAAEAIGVPSFRYKVIAFAISGGFGSIAGSMYAHSISFVSAETWGFSAIVTFFVMLFIGSVASPWGAIAGAAIAIVVPEELKQIASISDLQSTYFSVGLVLVLILRPKGLLSPLSSENRVGRLLHRRHRRSRQVR